MGGMGEWGGINITRHLLVNMGFGIFRFSILEICCLHNCLEEFDGEVSRKNKGVLERFLITWRLLKAIFSNTLRFQFIVKC